jgi:hypothetical protein
MSIGRLTWPNGAQAHLFSAEEADRLRGYNFDYAWCDELCAFGPNVQDVWDMLQFATRVTGPKGDAAFYTCSFPAAGGLPPISPAVQQALNSVCRTRAEHAPLLLQPFREEWAAKHAELLADPDAA